MTEEEASDTVIQFPGRRTGSPASRARVAVPAHPDFVAIVRGAVRSAAVVADLTYEDVEELQIAVNDAAALLLALDEHHADAELAVDIDIDPGRVGLRLSVPGYSGTSLDRESLAWMVLSTIAPDVEVVQDRDVAIEFSRTRAESLRG